MAIGMFMDWDGISAEQYDEFQRFVDERLNPGVAAAGLPGEPEVRIFEVHTTFTPAFTPA